MRQQDRGRWQSTGNRSYTNGREDFGSNSRKSGGWNESSRQPQPRRLLGKGSKDLMRPDDRIKKEVHDALTWNRDVDTSEIEVEVKEGEVSLTGSVSDQRMKRLAEELVEDISDVRDVSNHLRVRKKRRGGFSSPSDF